MVQQARRARRVSHRLREVALVVVDIVHDALGDPPPFRDPGCELVSSMSMHLPPV